MLEDVKCFLRDCEHFKGILQPFDNEYMERPVCSAFPDKIPYVIAFGDEKHLKSFSGDKGIKFKKRKD